MPETREFNQMIRNLRGDIDDLARLTVRRYRRQAADDARITLTRM